MLFSFILLILAVISFKLSDTGYKSKVAFMSLLLLNLVFLILFVVSDILSGNGIDDSVIYHFLYGLEGAGIYDFSTLILQILIALLFAIGVTYLYVFKIQSIQKHRKFFIVSSFLLLLLSFAFTDTTRVFTKILFPTLSSNETSYVSFNKYYLEPNITKKDEEFKNLVFIYTEGIEQTHLDESLFPGLTPNLNKLQKKSIYFKNINSPVGTKFTIGGIVAGHCGIPLLAPSHLNAFSSMDTFLPNIKCVGDLLHDEGYYLSYFGGADLKFAGKGKFFETHKFDEMYGRDTLSREMDNPDYSSWWGLYDDTTFDFAYKRFIELSENNQNFAQFILTLDAHHPWGNPSALCKSLTYDNEIELLKAVHCSDFLVSELVEKIRNSEYGKDTIIVVASDHLALQSDATKILESAPNGRSNLFMILTPDEKVRAVDRVGSTLDVITTVFPFMGLGLDLGLGRNLLSLNYDPEEINVIQSSLKGWEPIYNIFWDFPRLENKLEINIASTTYSDENYLSIDGRNFGIPVMVEFEDNLDTNIIFKHHKSDMIHVDEEYSIFKNRISEQNIQYNGFILIDLCSEIEKIYQDHTVNTDGFCYIIGAGDSVKKTGYIEDTVLFTSDHLLELLDI